ncbi:hypothetical protein Dimus_003472 [Dionaea muscipula]
MVPDFFPFHGIEVTAFHRWRGWHRRPGFRRETHFSRAGRRGLGLLRLRVLKRKSFWVVTGCRGSEFGGRALRGGGRCGVIAEAPASSVGISGSPSLEDVLAIVSFVKGPVLGNDSMKFHAPSHGGDALLADDAHVSHVCSPMVTESLVKVPIVLVSSVVADSVEVVADSAEASEDQADSTMGLVSGCCPSKMLGVALRMLSSDGRHRWPQTSEVVSHSMAGVGLDGGGASAVVGQRLSGTAGGQQPLLVAPVVVGYSSVGGSPGSG